MPNWQRTSRSSHLGYALALTVFLAVFDVLDVAGRPILQQIAIHVVTFLAAFGLAQLVDRLIPQRFRASDNDREDRN